jgi:hypothetical protein
MVQYLKLATLTSGDTMQDRLIGKRLDRLLEDASDDFFNAALSSLVDETFDDIKRLGKMDKEGSETTVEMFNFGKINGAKDVPQINIKNKYIIK